MASACEPWFRYVALATSPPVYPTRVDSTPGRLRMRSCIPQKHPPARIAFSVVPLIGATSSPVKFFLEQLLLSPYRRARVGRTARSTLIATAADGAAQDDDPLPGSRP